MDDARKTEIEMEESVSYEEVEKLEEIFNVEAADCIYPSEIGGCNVSLLC